MLSMVLLLVHLLRENTGWQPQSFINWIKIYNIGGSIVEGEPLLVVSPFYCRLKRNPTKVHLHGCILFGRSMGGVSMRNNTIIA